MATPPKARTDVVANAGVTLFGMLYIAVAGSFYLIILKSTDRAPRALVLAILGLTFLYDVAAFFIGRYWGRHPLAPTISPRKSVQGLIGATFVTLLVASVLPRSFGPFDTELKLFALGLTVVIFAPLGDLAESLLKRDLGIKDMGSILPGHGGMLDRVDSAIFVGPAVFYLMRLIH
jgi:phosphatidate cytidylyltransferase